MKKKIALLGSTGSIGKTLLNIVKKNTKDFEIILLTANKNYKKLLQQTKDFNVRNVIITNKESYEKFKISNKNKKIKIYSDYSKFNKIFKNKIDYAMSSIVGLNGLVPTLKIIKFTKTIAIANKESLICGWNLINKEILKFNTKFIPVDSEHFSIWYALRGIDKNLIEKIYLTASGGPFLDKPLKKLKSVNIQQAINHPNWKMGKKISIDSSNLMNKVLEIIEAYRLFPFKIDKYEIIIHPQSLVHAIVHFKNGQTRFLYHETDMKIPISNAIFENNFDNKNFIYPKKDILKKFENLQFIKVDKKRFPIVTLLGKFSSSNSGPIILNASNEVLVNKFIDGKISFNSIYAYLKAVLVHKDYKKYAIKSSPNINEIYKIDNWARNKTMEILGEK